MQKCCSFFGHREIIGEIELGQKIKDSIKKIILEENITCFWLGRNGNFDRMCSNCLKELKKEFPFIKVYLVYAYLKEETDEYEKKYIKETFDGTIYPPLENVPPKFAILKRNEWIARNSDYFIFYVNYTWGGAAKILNYAKRKNKAYINLGKLK